MIRLIIFFCFVLVSLAAEASYTPSNFYYYFGTDIPEHRGSTADAACKTAGPTWYDGGDGKCHSGVSASYYGGPIGICQDGSLAPGMVCADYTTTTTAAVTTTTTTTTTQSCPPLNSTINLDWPVGYAGEDGRPVGALNIPPYGASVASGSCKYKLDNLAPAGCRSDSSQAAPRLVKCSYVAVSMGVPTDGSEIVPNPGTAPNLTPDNGKCPEGTVSGGVDSSGIPICIGKAPDRDPNAGKETIKKDPPVSNPDGSTTETETKERTNSDGSKTTTTTTTTTGADGKKTVTVTQNTSGTPTGSKGTPDSESDFCKKNPQLAICKNSTVSGSCENTSCEGDAIQCEILRQQRKEYCDGMKDTPESNLGKSILSGADPKQGEIANALKGTTVDLSSQSLDQSGFVGSGACFPNRNISVLGKTIEVSFTSVCNNLAPLRFGVIAVSLLAAYLLVSKSVLQG